MLKKVATAF